MVEAPCFAARQAARWNGSAHQVTTGSARAATTHCQPRNCSAGIIETSTTGTASTTASRSRRLRSSPRSGSGAEVSSEAGSAVPDLPASPLGPLARPTMVFAPADPAPA